MHIDYHGTRTLPLLNPPPPSRPPLIFREAALATLENVFKGYCGAIMAYGQTGTGKTHTMQGYAGGRRGRLSPNSLCAVLSLSVHR